MNPAPLVAAIAVAAAVFRERDVRLVVVGGSAIEFCTEQAEALQIRGPYDPYE